MNPSTALGNKVIIAVQQSCPRARVFRRVVASVHPIGQPDIVMKVGIPGQADLYGYTVSRHPEQPAVPFEIELKVGRDRESADQVNWRELCKILGVPHLVLSAPDKTDFSAAVQQAVTFVKNL